MEYLDCSELVCSVLEADELTGGVKSMNTSALKAYFLGDNWIIDDSPRVGDVFLYRHGGAGHTGLVTAIVSNNIVQITHARGRKCGTRTETRNPDNLRKRNGWVGFVRPKQETPDGPTSHYGFGSEPNPMIWPQLVDPSSL